jgi:hypothetical protein
LVHHPEICFVLTITVRFNGKGHECSVNLYEGAAFERLASGLKVAIIDLEGTLPKPEASPVNARYLLNGPNRAVGRSFLGGCSMGGTEVEISSRVLVRLLSGEMGQKEFQKAHHDVHRFFATLIAEGRMVREILVRAEPEKDDDWVVFRFGDADPAISPFRVAK